VDRPDASALAAIAEGPVAERLLAAVERAGRRAARLSVLGHREISLSARRRVRRPSSSE
jgi:hypothetical protein